MEMIPALEIGWLNGWIPLGLLVLVEGLLLIVFPRDVRRRLLDRSGWDKKQVVFTILGKLFSLVCLVLIILTPLKVGTTGFFAGIALYTTGLVGLVVAIYNFRSTPTNEPVTQGLCRISRHPQIVMLFVIFLGMCLAIGSWLALFVLMISRILQHYGILAEEEACLRQFSESYRDYMKRVPRYFVFF